jgi:hypothetical protein
MAHLRINGNLLTLELSVWEKLGAFHSSPSIQLGEVAGVEVVENPWTGQVLKGVRAPGTGVPFLVLLGTMRYSKGKDFCAFYKRRPCVVVSHSSGPFKRWIVEIKDMSEVQSLKEAIAA